MASYYPNRYVPLRAICPVCIKSHEVCYLTSDNCDIQAASLELMRRHGGKMSAYVDPPSIDEFEASMNIKFACASMCDLSGAHAMMEYEAACPQCFSVLREIHRQRIMDHGFEDPIVELRHTLLLGAQYNLANEMPWLKCFAAEHHGLTYNLKSIGSVHRETANEMGAPIAKRNQSWIINRSWPYHSRTAFVPSDDDWYYNAKWDFDWLPAFSGILEAKYDYVSRDGLVRRRAIKVSNFNDMMEAVIVRNTREGVCNVCNDGPSIV